MAHTSRFERLRRLMRELRTANGANVTITFALATIPMVGFVGAAVDYSHANAVKAAMQMAADSTALMLSKTASTLNNSDLQTKANAYFKALLPRTDAGNLVVTATYTTTPSAQVVINASSDVKTNFMGLLGFSSLKVAVDSQVKWGNTKLRVALVLDTTGSMSSDGKMTALKTATKALLDQLKAAAAANGDVYVSIIPFSKGVNVGTSNYKANWIYWGNLVQDPTKSDTKSWDALNGKCSKNSYDTRQECESNGKNWTVDNHNKWNGCVMDRGDPNGPNTGNYDTNVVAPTTSNNATKFAAEEYSNCSKAVMPLNYNWTAMKKLVDDLDPDGTTNQGVGLAHGWMSLVGGGPYPAPPAEDPNYKYSKVIILMSDGLNTQNRWYNNASQINTRQQITCTNAKATGITIYTIHVNTDGDPLSTLLQGCASSSDKFWMLTSASQLVGTFQQIGTSLSNLRIAQ